jgi:hypothetical protein
VRRAKKVPEILDEPRRKRSIRKSAKKHTSIQMPLQKLGYIAEGSVQPMGENHAALLTDERLSQLTDAGQKARMLNHLQQHHGNAYVQKIVDQIQGMRDEELNDGKFDAKSGNERPPGIKRGRVTVQRQPVEAEETAKAEPKEGAISKLKNAVEKLRTSLEREQIKDLLRQAATCQALGADAAAKEALNQAAEIALEMLKRKTAGFDVQIAKKEMVTELLNAVADVLKLGGDEKAVESAMKKALDWAEAQLALAVERLKTTPTEATAKQVLIKAADVMLLGGDAKEAMDLFMAWKEESGKTAESATAG